jgi:hypothetical protein
MADANQMKDHSDDSDVSHHPRPKSRWPQAGDCPHLPPFERHRLFWNFFGASEWPAPAVLVLVLVLARHPRVAGGPWFANANCHTMPCILILTKRTERRMEGLTSYTACFESSTGGRLASYLWKASVPSWGKRTRDRSTEQPLSLQL